MSCYSCDEADRCLGRVTRVFLTLAMIGLGVFLVANMGEIKRYVKLSTM